MNRLIYQFAKLSDAEVAFRLATTTDHHYTSPCRWSVLGPLLSNAVAKATYVIPVAGYVILFSDFFENLFKFSSLNSGAFLTPWQRLNMAYYGSAFLLLAFLLYKWRAPRLTRSSKDSLTFVTNLIVAKDLPAIICVAQEMVKLYDLSRIHEIEEPKRAQLLDLQQATQACSKGRVNPHAFSDDVPNFLRSYYNWQNISRYKSRYAIFLIAMTGYALLLLPAVDIFIQVIRTGFHRALS